MKKSAHESQSPEVAFAHSELGQALIRVLGEGSSSYRTIADYLLRNQVRVTALGIEELAESCQVSTATISRFARDIGFKNYAAMRGAVAEVLQGVLQPVEKLRNNIERREGAASPATESLEFAAANIGATGKGLALSEMDKVVHKLTRAGTVYVMGFGLSTHLAGLLAMHLQPFCPHVVEVAGHGGTEVAAGHLATITAKDVLIVISFPRYALDVIRLANFARSRQASIVSLTDSPASPLAELADHVLYAQSSHPVLPSSSTAAVALIEALVVSLMVSNKDNVEKAARLTEAISAYLYGADAALPARPKKNAR
ncbi:MurR/RpiR family transcriptional regulator [Pseudoduganella aquatica]|uniref:SIS domain-containing protein n=1 Tax=Pseudoduganella aquatica TaxID=2660641 RepID=A0A7X4KK44_9BURK|nr:MurR/RpiR family transcriptional regulator [Pseudoduganella aquatica]MYN06759.1 SIS domain-containing protein [Pseudoduganella aquatica]